LQDEYTWLRHHRILWLTASLIITVLLSDTPSFSFENIEADAAYNRQIKEQIRKEFSTGLEMLKAQADNMGMLVRDKDVAELNDICTARQL
jgi:hypothetical protein